MTPALTVPGISPTARSLWQWGVFIAQQSRGTEFPTVAGLSRVMALTPGSVRAAANELAALGLAVQRGDILVPVLPEVLL